MTLNHQQNIRNKLSIQNKRIRKSKSHQKEVLHLFLLVLGRNHFFHEFNLQIDPLTLQIILNHTINVLSDQKHNKKGYYMFLFLFVFAKKTFFF